MTTAPAIISLVHRINWRTVVFGTLIAGAAVVWGFAIYGAVVAFGGAG